MASLGRVEALISNGSLSVWVLTVVIVPRCRGTAPGTIHLKKGLSRFTHLARSRRSLSARENALVSYLPRDGRQQKGGTRSNAGSAPSKAGMARCLRCRRTRRRSSTIRALSVLGAGSTSSSVCLPGLAGDQIHAPGLPDDRVCDVVPLCPTSWTLWRRNGKCGDGGIEVHSSGGKWLLRSARAQRSGRGFVIGGLRLLG